MDLYSEKLEVDSLNWTEDSSKDASGIPEIALNKESEFEKKTILPLLGINILSQVTNEKNPEINSESNKKETQDLNGHSKTLIENEYDKGALKSVTELSVESIISGKENTEVNSKSKSKSQSTYPIEEDSSSQLEATSEPVRRKRKQKLTKEELKDLKPTRESKRIRKTPLVPNYDSSSKMRSIWTDDEKKQLLRGLEDFGMDNIKDIKTYLKNKSESAIYNQIRMWRLIGQNELEKHLAMRPLSEDNTPSNCILRLNEWLKQFENLSASSSQGLFALSNVFLIIAEYGKFPSPSDCEGIDFRALYRYIHCMLNGKPYYGMNQKTASVLQQSLNGMFRFMKSRTYLSHMIPHLHQMIRNDSSTNKSRPHKTYSRQHKIFSSTLSINQDGFLNTPGLNPMNLPPHLLLKVDVEDDEDSDEDDFENNYDIPTKYGISDEDEEDGGEEDDDNSDDDDSDEDD